ncbi:L-type lectin-domain containing protein [Bythopirellula goksoeyrii]|uniref:Legume lectin domain protein n=1 Tax=Bythopirellula goksoeyrii TaxID=1400387 RepID=A0A5B9Q6X2_9BACT|nr:L-type lectin-domain containing protein [Bythopirellula goksoeyrii]QEG34768.1 Legume lectin domain protein [Bythopirellula goksoeyrii]
MCSVYLRCQVFYSFLVFLPVWYVAPAVADFHYSDFSSVDGIRMRGDAIQSGNRLRLTPAAYHQHGSAWIRYREIVDDGFRCRFQFQMTGGGSQPGFSGVGGDGLAFVIQNSSVTALGDYGSGIGYGGVGDREAIPNSVAVEFDTWKNSDLNDPNGNHVSVHTRGLSPNSPHEDYSLGSTTFVPDFLAGAIHTVELRYLPGVMDIFVDDLATPVFVVPLDLNQTLALSQGQAWIGFTASTWNGWANHDILNASFNAIPESDTFLMLTMFVWVVFCLSALFRRSPKLCT